MVDTIEYLNDSSKIQRMSIPIFPNTIDYQNTMLKSGCVKYVLQ